MAKMKTTMMKITTVRTEKKETRKRMAKAMVN